MIGKTSIMGVADGLGETTSSVTGVEVIVGEGGGAMDKVRISDGLCFGAGWVRAGAGVAVGASAGKIWLGSGRLVGDGDANRFDSAGAKMTWLTSSPSPVTVASKPAIKIISVE
jgi:hypothetical protein